jgi:hypothetical protein
MKCACDRLKRNTRMLQIEDSALTNANGHKMCGGGALAEQLTNKYFPRVKPYVSSFTRVTLIHDRVRKISGATTKS